jgi:hypothetical protein
MDTMETGQKVKWTITGQERTGIFMRQISEHAAEVMCLSFRGRRMVMPTEVPLHLLEKLEREPEIYGI